MVELNMKEMGTVARAVFKSGYPLLIRGRHGIGKSEFVYQFAKEAGLVIEGEEKEYKVIERRAALMTEGDLTGLPYRGPEINGQTSTKFNPPDWFLEACEEPRIIFFDEVDRGITEVRQGIFQINDSRQLNGHELHPNSRVVACINGGIHGINYQVGDFDPAELDRYQVYDFEPTVDEWATYCRSKGVMPEIITFCTEQQKFLEVIGGAPDPTKVTPSRRSWVRLSHTLTDMPQFENGIEDEHKELLFTIAQGYVGEEAASAFSTYALDYQRIVKPEDIVFKGKLEALEKFTEADWIEFVEAFADSGIMEKDDMTEDNFSNIRQIFIRDMPAEAMIVFWQRLCVGGKFEVGNIHKLGWDFDNEDTEEEQVEFTRVITERLLEPPENEDINEMINKVQKDFEKKAKESEEDSE